MTFIEKIEKKWREQGQFDCDYELGIKLITVIKEAQKFQENMDNSSLVDMVHNWGPVYRALEDIHTSKEEELKGLFERDTNQEFAGGNEGLYFDQTTGQRLRVFQCGSCYGNLVFKWNNSDFNSVFRCPKCGMKHNCRK